MPEKPPRPGQATFAAWLIIGGSVILVVTAWQRIATLHTLEVQEELQRVLSEPPLSGTGLGLNGLKTTIRVLCMVAAAAATASAILGWHALRRSTSARLALTLLAPLVLIGGFATAGFFAPLVVAGVCMLWLRPTRDWFAGRPWVSAASALAQRQRRADPFAPQASPKPDDHPTPTAGSGPGPFQGEYGAPSGPSVQPDVPGPPGQPGPAHPSDRPGSPYGVPAKRPGALIAACVVVWAACAMVTGFMLLFSVVMAVARDEFFDEIERQQPDFDMQGLSEGELATGTFVATAIVVLWCGAAMVLAALAFRRLRWARTALLVSTGISGLVLLGATFVSPLLVVLLAANVATVWLLLRSDVTAWFTPGDRR